MHPPTEWQSRGGSGSSSRSSRCSLSLSVVLITTEFQKRIYVVFCFVFTGACLGSSAVAPPRNSDDDSCRSEIRQENGDGWLVSFRFVRTAPCGVLGRLGKPCMPWCDPPKGKKNGTVVRVPHSVCAQLLSCFRRDFCSTNQSINRSIDRSINQSNYPFDSTSARSNPSLTARRTEPPCRRCHRNHRCRTIGRRFFGCSSLPPWEASSLGTTSAGPPLSSSNWPLFRRHRRRSPWRTPP